MTLVEDRAEALRWGSAFVIVLLAHAAPAVVAAYWLGPAIHMPAPEPAILIDMAPPAAPPVPPSEQPPGPKQIKAEAHKAEPPKRKAPEDSIKTPPVSKPAVAVPIAPPQPPQVDARTAAPQTTAPPARPLPPAPQASSGQVTWQGLVLGRLNQFKRYPPGAQRRREQGVPYIRFVMDRNGKVLSTTLERSSGFADLDREAVKLPERAEPLPKPPADVNGDRIELVVPIEFFITGRR